jgi:FkbM family methyltransferase
MQLKFSEMMKAMQYLKLLKPPTMKFMDHLIYLSLCVLTGILVLPLSLFGNKTFKQSIFTLFPRFMPKDLLIKFRGCRFKARKGKVDILLLSELSEPFMSQYFKPKEDDIVVDCGAHVGKYTLPASKMVGGGKVIAIEAHPENYHALLENIDLNRSRNIMALNVAAFDYDGQIELNDAIHDAGYGVKGHSSEDSILVKARTIDSILLGDLGLSKVDYMKIDVEGAEVEVLKGARKIIAKSPDIKILIEVERGYEIEVDTILNELGCDKSEYLGDVGASGNVCEKYYFKSRGAC